MSELGRGPRAPTVTEGSSGLDEGAAVELGIPRSKVRRTLEALERSAEVPLLWADSGGVHLTPAGRIFGEHGPALIDEHRALLQAARALADESLGRR